jgi:hypothetical protein
VPFAHADDEPAGPGAYGAHHGYLSDVKEERNRREIEMVMLARPKENTKPLSEVIFNQKLSKEFQTQYQSRFGQTQAEQVINTQARSDEYNYYTGQNVTIQEYQKRQKEFGEYMTRRLIEYHVDDWAKNDPQFRPVYAVKEKMSNLSVAVKKGYKFKWKYNFAGPNMELRLENPYDIETKVRLEMTGILSSPTETIYSLGIPVTNKVYASAIHRSTDQFSQLIFSRPLTRSISGWISGSWDASNAGLNIKQDIYMIGASWAD